MIFVAGPSGSGKTSTLEGFVKRYPRFIHLRASSILKDEHRPTFGASTRDLELNQTVIRRHLTQRKDLERVILDGHMVIPSGEVYYAVPIHFLVGLDLRLLVHLWADANTIALRKGIKLTPDFSEQLEKLQRMELAHMEQAAKATGCPLISFNSVQTEDIHKVLLDYGMRR